MVRCNLSGRRDPRKRPAVAYRCRRYVWAPSRQGAHVQKSLRNACPDRPPWHWHGHPSSASDTVVRGAIQQGRPGRGHARQALGPGRLGGAGLVAIAAGPAIGDRYSELELGLTIIPCTDRWYNVVTTQARTLVSTSTTSKSSLKTLLKTWHTNFYFGFALEVSLGEFKFAEKLVNGESLVVEGFSDDNHFLVSTHYDLGHVEVWKPCCHDRYIR